VSIVSSALASLELSPEEIARRSRLPLDRVQAIMSGSPAKMSEVRALSSGLRVSKHFLAPKSRARESDLRLLFRSTPGAREKFDLTVERVSDYVDSCLSILPERHEPAEWLQAFPESEETYGAARLLAQRYRYVFFSGDIQSPLTALPSIVSQTDGIILAPLRESRFEGISLFRDNYFFVFVSPRFSGRMLFTLAHELGHVLAHRDRLSIPILEGGSSIGNFRKAQKSERFVDAFASCLLLPDNGVFEFLSFFRRDRKIPLDAPVGDIEILLLARFYGVSFDVAAHRCEDLKLLPNGGAFSIADHLRKHHGSPEKRADELGLQPREHLPFPILSPHLRSELERRIEAGESSIGWASDRFGLSLAEIMEMHRSERR
jgi:Zn-dependent peptidase ImmA (M78 family)